MAPFEATPGARPRRAALVCNPRAGSLAELPDAAAWLSAALAQAGFEVATLAPGDAPIEEQWRRAVAAGADVVFAAGGDGTLRAVAALALRDGVLVAFLPGGTMNRVCARLGLPPALPASVAAYAEAEPGRMSVGFAAGEPFLYQAMFGAPTRLLRYREKQRHAGLLGWAALARATWRQLRSLTERQLRVVTARGRMRPGRVVVVTLPEDDGPYFQVDTAAPRGALARARMAWRWFRGRLRDDIDVASIGTRELAVFGTRRGLRYSLDGEMRLGPPPVRLRLVPGALRILRPRRMAGK
jgi:diacylglycerol kinase family enzyme